VTDIVRSAVLGSYGVAGFATPRPWGHLVRLLGLGEPGIRVDLDDLAMELRIRVAYGLPIAEVARQVESAVRYAMDRDLGRAPGSIEVHVDGLVQREGSVPPPLEVTPADARAPDGTAPGDGHDAPPDKPPRDAAGIGGGR
jgi:uncharacterized alkaline shock family protein YloU